MATMVSTCQSSGKVTTLCMMVAMLVFIQTSIAHPASSSEIRKRQSGESSTSDNNPVNLISVERTPTPQGNRFTVRFTKNVENLAVAIHAYPFPAKVPDSIVEEENGVWAASFTREELSMSPYRSPWIIIADHDHSKLIHMMVDNSESSPASQDIVELPEIHLNPAQEAVYGPGEDIFLEAFSPRNSETGEVIQNLRQSFAGVDLDTGIFHMHLDNNAMYRLGHPWVTDDRIQANMTLLTSTHHLSGFLQLSTSVEDTGGQLVLLIEVSRSLLVRPAGQSGPFPSGYLSIANLPSSETSQNGNELIRCNVGQECSLPCFAVGETISDVRVSKVLPNGAMEPVPLVQAPMRISYLHSVYWMFQAREDSGDSEGITTFQCLALDAEHGTVRTKLVDVLAVIEGSIDGERSSAVVEDDPMDPTKKRITLKCAVRGRPLPSTYFGEDYPYILQLFSATESIVSTDQNEAVATKVVTVDTQDLVQLNHQIRAGNAHRPYCEIFSTVRGQMNRHYFDVSVPGCK